MRHGSKQRTANSGLTMKQHVFPRRSIKRFSNGSGLVQVFRKSKSVVQLMQPTVNFFCAERAWDQRSEAVYGKHFEDAFQDLADSIISGNTESIRDNEKIVVEQFFALWRARHQFTIQRAPDVSVEGIDGDAISTEEQDDFERKHVMSMRDGVLEGRFVAGVQLAAQVQMFVRSNKDTNWGIVRSGGGEFIVPDYFQNLMIVPLSPTISIMAGQPNTTIGAYEVAYTNKVAVEQSAEYYFARDFEACPILCNI